MLKLHNGCTSQKFSYLPFKSRTCLGLSKWALHFDWISHNGNNRRMFFSKEHWFWLLDQKTLVLTFGPSFSWQPSLCIHRWFVTGFRESWFKERHCQPKLSRYILNFVNDNKKVSQPLIKKVNIWGKKFYQMDLDLHTQILIGILWHLKTHKYNTHVRRMQFCRLLRKCSRVHLIAFQF